MTTTLDELWGQLPDNGKQLINILNQVQDEQGYIPRTLLTELAGRAGVPESQLHGLVSFFSSFRTRPAGKHRISICYGTACYARGVPLIYDRLADELHLNGDDTSASKNYGPGLPGCCCAAAPFPKKGWRSCCSY